VLDPEVEWVLQRAFGPPEWTPKREILGSRLANVSLQLDLASRISARHPRELIEREVGATAGHRFREQYVATVARGALLDHALNELLRIAQTQNIACILLKYAALSRTGVLRVGSRAATDLDVLVPQARAREFQAHLLQHGYRDLGLSESSHQLAALQAPSGVLVELHLHVPLITLAHGQPFARAEDLQQAGLLTRSWDSALVPDSAVLAAHAIAHGLMQHAQAPHMCSPLKTFADLADLQVTTPDVVERARPYLIRTMTVDDLASVETLTRALQNGDLQLAMKGGPGVILRHALAGQLDRRYALCLRVGSLVRNRGTSKVRSPAQLFKSLSAAWEFVRTGPNRAP